MTQKKHRCNNKFIFDIFRLILCIKYLFLKICRIFVRLFKYLYCISFENEQKWLIIRSILSYIFGIMLAFLFWEFILLDLQFDTNLSYKLLLLFIIIFGLGCTYSRKFRCISSLIFAEFLGKRGRSFLRALIFAFIIAGPVTNLSLNGKEIIRVFACATILTFNLTQTRFNLMMKPFQNAVFKMKDNMSEIQSVFGNVEKIINPIIEEVELDDNTENINTTTITTTTTISSFKTFRSYLITNSTLEGDKLEKAEIYQNHYKEKLRKRCELQLEKGENRCKKAFEDAYNDCYEKLPAVIDTLLCWPMKITLICNIEVYGFSKGENGICDPKNVLDENFGENYNNLKDIEDEFTKNITSVQINYEFINVEKIPGVKSAQESSEILVSQFEYGKLIFDKCMYIMNKILAFLFIKVIFGAISYHKYYLKDINADNIYVTSYFKRIDERRKKHNQHSLLPLKKVERLTIIDLSNLSQRSKTEKTKLMANFLQFALELITVCMFLIIDHIIYILLDIVRDNAKIEYIQDGEHVLVIDVNGTGLIAQLVKSTLDGFNINVEVHTILTDEPCLPNPGKLPDWFYIKLLILLLSVILFIFNESITFRLKRTICSYFYPQREKKRIIHLYNQMLKRRRTLFISMAREVKRQLLKKHKLQMKINILTKLRIKVPWLFGWLKNCKFTRRNCLICREPEPRYYDPERPYNFKECETLDCFYVHCEECWFEIGEICLACNQLIIETDDVDFSD